MEEGETGAEEAGGEGMASHRPKLTMSNAEGIDQRTYRVRGKGRSGAGPLGGDMHSWKGGLRRSYQFLEVSLDRASISRVGGMDIPCSPREK